ncbi:hypothetical protein GCM10027285_08760 [Oleiagrimonas citrea]
MERLGVGRAWPRHRYRADQAAVTLGAMLEDDALNHRAAEVGAIVARKDGAETGAQRILQRLDEHPRR